MGLSDVNQNVTIPVTLEVGQISESVAVTGTVQLVDTVSGSVKEVVDETRVRELPLNGRNVLQLQQPVILRRQAPIRKRQAPTGGTGDRENRKNQLGK